MSKLTEALDVIENMTSPLTDSNSTAMPGSIASPWPARDIVSKLIEATNILLDDKNYDGHGWELIQAARAEASKWLKQ